MIQIYSHDNGRKFLLFDISQELKIKKDDQIIFLHLFCGPNEDFDIFAEQLRKVKYERVSITEMNILFDNLKKITPDNIAACTLVFFLYIKHMYSHF